jgi:RNA polymerase sigma factor (sigma-70 family)
MRRILDSLPGMSEIDRDILVLSWQRLSYAEIALALDLPLGTVRSRLSRARARLRIAASPSDDHSEPAHAPFVAIGDGK